MNFDLISSAYHALFWVVFVIVVAAWGKIGDLVPKKNFDNYLAISGLIFLFLVLWAWVSFGGLSGPPVDDY